MRWSTLIQHVYSLLTIRLSQLKLLMFRMRSLPMGSVAQRNIHMSKSTHLIPPEIREVLGPPPLPASENPKRWNETLARYVQSYPPKDADDFEGWRNVWNLACDHWEEERMKRFKVEVLEAPRRAKLEQKFLVAGFSQIAGYSCLSLVRAFLAGICQSALVWVALGSCGRAATS